MLTKVARTPLLILLIIAVLFSGCGEKVTSCKLPDMASPKPAVIQDCSISKTFAEIKTCDKLNHNEKEREIIEWREFGEGYKRMKEESQK